MHPTHSPARLNGSRGFSLLELIVVLAVLAIAAVMAAPTLTRFARGRQARDAAANLLALIQFAQDRAVVTATPHRLNLDTTNGQYWITMRRHGAFERVHHEFGRTFTLPDNMTATWITPLEATERGYMQFDSDGGHDAAIMALRSRDGRVWWLASPAPVEPYRVIDAATHGESR